MTIGEKIKYYRNLNGLSQRNLAQKLGIFYTAVGK
jgi:transcriptional regulator with XRE-family HTH domain